MNIIFMGPPGAGKGTQSENIIKRFNIPHISTGDMFREAISNKTDFGIEAKRCMDDGKLVPDEVTINIVKERLMNSDCNTGFLLDGFPRTLNQAKALDKILADMNRKIDFTINIDVPFDVLINRLIKRRICKSCGVSYHLEFKPSKVDNICDKCGGELYQRQDDNEISAKTRLDVYTNETRPLIEYYSSVNKLIHIDGLQSVEDVLKDIISAIEE